MENNGERSEGQAVFWGEWKTHQQDFVIMHQTVSFAFTENTFTAQAANRFKWKGNEYIIQQERAMHTLYNQRLCLI